MGDDRECTCHPDEAPVPCQKKYAFTECEITRLREENARLREALKPFAKCIETYPDAKDDYEIGFGGVHDADCKVFIRDFRAAAAAIREGGKDG